jgi:hypothetical protein
MGGSRVVDCLWRQGRDDLGVRVVRDGAAVSVVAALMWITANRNRKSIQNRLIRSLIISLIVVYNSSLMYCSNISSW